MNLKDLCDYISLPDEMKEKMLSISDDIADEKIKTIFHNLKDSKKWQSTLDGIKKDLGDDRDGSKHLTVMLLCALKSHEEYIKRNIDEKIFIDTMKFCTRFVNSHRNIYGTYAFTWAWWFPRQLSLREFRIGALEYEIREYENVIHIHIPADADMSIESVRKSYNQAKKFFKKFFPEVCGMDMVCDSWLLSPVLKQMLPPDSNILDFQNLFRVVRVDEASNAGLQWLYGNENTPLENLPENTSLQRKMKKHLLAGNSTGSAFGILNEESF